MNSIEINVDEAIAKTDALYRAISNGSPLFQKIAGALEHETEVNFDQEGRPGWQAWAPATKAARLKRNNGSSDMKMLQDRGILAASIFSAFGDDFSAIGAGGAARDYAAIQHLGGTIHRSAYSTKVRLRTKESGDLLRQPNNKHLAVFAKDDHKRVRESWHEVPAYSFNLPARPYLPFIGSGSSAELQPEAVSSIFGIITAMANEALT